MKPLAGSDGERDTVVIIASVPSQSAGGAAIALVVRWSYVGDTFSICRGRIVRPGRVCLDAGIRQV